MSHLFSTNHESRIWKLRKPFIKVLEGLEQIWLPIWYEVNEVMNNYTYYDTSEVETDGKIFIESLLYITMDGTGYMHLINTK